MKVQKKWAVFMSQTGSEIIAISRELGYLPGIVVTNNVPKMTKENLEFLIKNGVIVLPFRFKPAVDDYLLPGLLEKELITLHGFLRILPADFLKQYKGEIYNGHPGLIDEYPELKGKDPQIRAWERKYDKVGSVIHRVTEGVDEGEVVKSVSVPNTAQSLDEIYYILRNTSLQAWKSFFEENWKF